MKLYPITFGTLQLQDSIPICNCRVDEKRRPCVKTHLNPLSTNQHTNSLRWKHTVTSLVAITKQHVR